METWHRYTWYLYFTRKLWSKDWMSFTSEPCFYRPIALRLMFTLQLIRRAHDYFGILTEFPTNPGACLLSFCYDSCTCPDYPLVIIIRKNSENRKDAQIPTRTPGRPT